MTFFLSDVTENTYVLLLEWRCKGPCSKVSWHIFIIVVIIIMIVSIRIIMQGTLLKGELAHLKFSFIIIIINNQHNHQHGYQCFLR